METVIYMIDLSEGNSSATQQLLNLHFGCVRAETGVTEWFDGACYLLGGDWGLLINLDFLKLKKGGFL